MKRKQNQSPARISDYLSLTKPRINSLVLITTFVGMWLAAQEPPPAFKITFLTLLGTCLTVAGASALNCFQEREIDAKMPRTQDRPLPAGRISPTNALRLGTGCSTLGIMILLIGVNTISAVLAITALLVYTPIYTWMKQITSLSTLIGAIPGAIPPLIGWSAIRGTIELPGILLFLIMFVWQPPHFLALALFRKDEYNNARLQMLPIELNESASLRQIIIYATCLIPLSLIPSLIDMAGLLYFYVALILGILFLIGSLMGLLPRFNRNPRWAKGLFSYSILYLTLIFTCLVVNP